MPGTRKPKTSDSAVTSPIKKRGHGKPPGSTAKTSTKAIKQMVTAKEIVMAQADKYFNETREISELQWEVFFTSIANTAHITRACNAARISRATVYCRKSADPEFAQLLEDAMQVGYDNLMEEAQRRAFEGYEKPVYQGGLRVGMIREFSDSLAMFLLKGYKPKTFKDRTENVNVNLDARQGLSEAELRQAILTKLNGSTPALVPTDGGESV